MTIEKEIIPSVFTEAMYLIEGKPFRFKGREYLKTLYDTDIKYGLLKTGRQVEKSTTLSVKIANDVLLKPFNRDLYVSPMNEQVKTFSKERLAKLFRYSRDNIVRKHYMAPGLSEQVYMREFNNGSTVWLRHCFERGDNIRGLSIDDLYIDEVQDILPDAIPVIQETQFASEHSSTWFTGTPKTFSNTIESLWLSSTQAEWVVKCPHCPCYQILGQANIKPDALRCRRCDGIITNEDVGHGFWEEMRPGKDLKGFHISQMMSPKAKMTDPDGKGVYQKMIGYTTAKFHNEVLGLSYENADKLITDMMLDGIMDNAYTFLDVIPDHLALTPFYMGIDWGTGDESFTVVSIFAAVGNKFRMIYTKRYDGGKESVVEYQLEHIMQTIYRYNIKLVVADWGFGFAQLQALRKEFGTRIAACYYVHSQKEKISYDDGKEMFKIRRTDIIMDYVTEMIHRKGAVWPGENRAELEFMRRHHLVEQAEYRQTMNGKSEEMILTHPVGCPDDGLHSCVYAFIAWKLDTGGMGDVYLMNRVEQPDLEFFSVESR